jgi:hypothetical protein
MLHAVLHGKLDESIPEPQRLEDALTSTVFGTLVWVDAWDILAHWLGVACAAPSSASSNPVRECWFWPRMALAEPDVVLRLGDVLVVVEAKYRSGRHDLVTLNEAEESLSDQLFRQHGCVTTPLDRRPRYADAIERAIKECHLIQVFVVDARRLRRARREYEQSKERLPPGACLELVTWQSLFRLIRESRLSPPRWAIDLRAYLELSGLDTFEGIGRRVTDDHDVPRISRWGARRAGSGFRLAVVEIVSGLSTTALRLWRSATGPTATKTGLHLVDHRLIDSDAPETILAWRRPREGHVARRTEIRPRKKRGKTQ